MSRACFMHEKIPRKFYLPRDICYSIAYLLLLLIARRCLKDLR